jgi:hypothetical protein
VHVQPASLFEICFELCEWAMTSFGIFLAPRLVEELERSLERGVTLRIVLGDRESRSDQEIDRQGYQLGRAMAAQATLLQWPPGATASR